MRHALLAWTPLHVVTSLNLIENFLKREDVTLYLYDEFTQAETLYRTLRELRKDIRVVRISYQKMGPNYRSIPRLFFNTNPFTEKFFDHLYFPGDNYFGRLLYAQHHKSGKKFHLHYFEDGMAPYLGVPPMQVNNWVDQLQLDWNKHSLFSGKWESEYLYRPDLVKRPLADQKISLPPLKAGNPALEIIREVFQKAYQIHPQEESEHGLLYFDQPFLHDKTGIDEVSVYQRVKEVADQVGWKAFVKLHPRSPKGKYGPVDYLETDLPWEIYLLFFDTKNLIMTTVNSTAALSPYLLFEEKTPVLFLTEWVYRMYYDQADRHTRQVLDNSRSLLHLVTALYQDRLFVPKDSEDLFEKLVTMDAASC